MRTQRISVLGLLIMVVGAVGLRLAEAGPMIVTVSGTEVTVEYDEPTKNLNGSAVTDLAKTNVYYQLPSLQPVKGPDVPATAATGGGHIQTKVTVPIPDQAEADVTFTATATDRSGNESTHSPPVVRRIDHLAPCPPASEDAICR